MIYDSLKHPYSMCIPQSIICKSTLNGDMNRVAYVDDNVNNTFHGGTYNLDGGKYVPITR